MRFGRGPPEGTPQEQDSIAVDPASGKVTDVLRFVDYPPLAQLTR
ncbi:hypothetical protein ACWDBD_12960 [Streptomyces sp. NPDC001118]